MTPILFCIPVEHRARLVAAFHCGYVLCLMGRMHGGWPGTKGDGAALGVIAVVALSPRYEAGTLGLIHGERLLPAMLLPSLSSKNLMCISMKGKRDLEDADDDAGEDACQSIGEERVQSWMYTGPEGAVFSSVKNSHDLLFHLSQTVQILACPLETYQLSSSQPHRPR